MIGRVYVVVSWLVLLSGLARAGMVPLPQAHAHNDYRHDPPLLKALQHGFTSVEADVFLVGETLCVAHDADEIKPERTLRSLYLEPLRRRARQNGGHVYATRSRFLLLVDIKSAAEPTYRRMHEILASYRDVVTSFGPRGRHEKAILVIISGNRPWELMKSQAVRYAGCDGRLSDLESDLPADLMPLISDRWGAHFTWRGAGPMPAEEREKLSTIVRTAHAQDRLVRFWATPDARSASRQTLWRELLSTGVDLINTDDLEGLKIFLLKHGR